MKLPRVTIPAGFITETDTFGVTTISMPDAGGCTLDWKARNWEPGYRMPVRRSSPPKYTGRGWAQRMTDDAVALLAGISKERSAKQGK